jgi:hypothetical protein
MTLLDFVAAHPLIALTILTILCVTLVCIVDLIANRHRPAYVPGRCPPPPPRPPSPQKDWSDGETVHHRTSTGAFGG